MTNSFISSVTASDHNITVTNNSYSPYYTVNATVPMDGVVRTNNGMLEYFNSALNCWITLPGSDVRIELGPMTRTVLDWVYQKMEEERKYEQMAEKYPAFAKAKENFELMKAMVKNEVA